MPCARLIDNQTAGHSRRWLGSRRRRHGWGRRIVSALAVFGVGIFLAIQPVEKREDASIYVPVELG